MKYQLPIGKSMKRVIEFIFLFFLCLIFTSPVLAVGSGPVNPFTFNATPGKKLGTVKLSWYHGGSIHTYNLFYGTDPNNLTYGVVDIDHKPENNEFVVDGLTPDKTYYFKLIGINEGFYAESGPILSKAASGQNSSPGIYFSKVKNYEMSYSFALSYGNKTGSVNVTWFSNDTADKYHLVYGTKPGEYLYGVQNMPNQQNLSNTFAVGSLTPGKTYYFSLVAEKNNKIVLWSQPLGITVR